MLTNMGNLPECIRVSGHYSVHVKSLTVVFVNSTPVKLEAALGGGGKEKKDHRKKWEKI